MISVQSPGEDDTIFGRPLDRVFRGHPGIHLSVIRLTINNRQNLRLTATGTAATFCSARQRSPVVRHLPSRYISAN